MSEKEALERRDIPAHAQTPWGSSQHITVYDEGIEFHSTSSHGGFKRHHHTLGRCRRKNLGAVHRQQGLVGGDHVNAALQRRLCRGAARLPAARRPRVSGVDDAARILLDTLGPDNVAAHRAFARAVSEEIAGRITEVKKAEAAKKKAEAKADHLAQKAEKAADTSDDEDAS